MCSEEKKNTREKDKVFATYYIYSIVPQQV